MTFVMRWPAVFALMLLQYGAGFEDAKGKTWLSWTLTGLCWLLIVVCHKPRKVR